MRFHRQLIDAINRRRELQLYYDGSICWVEPHTYGINYIGHYVLRGFQTAHGSEDIGPFCWKIFITSEIACLQETGGTFGRPRPGFLREATPMKRIFARLPWLRHAFIEFAKQEQAIVRILRFGSRPSDSPENLDSLSQESAVKAGAE